MPGYELRMIGHNARFAQACGVRTIKIVLAVALIGGMFSGLTAAGEVMGVYHKVYNNFAADMGFNGMTAALIGKDSTAGIIFGSLILGALQSGAVTLSVDGAGGQGLCDAVRHHQYPALSAAIAQEGGKSRMINVEQLLNLSVRLAAPVILICLGGLFSIKVGVFNLALEGFTLFGCFAAVVGTYMTQSVAGGIAFAVLVTLLIALICALACTTIATGLTRYLLVPVFGVSGRFILPSELALPTLHFELLEHVPMIGPILNDHSILVYLALILPFAVHVFLYRTSLGLSIRAIGRNADAAASAGIGVRRIRYFAVALNGVFCGLAGAQLALSLNMFNVGMTDGRGFTAIAVLVLTGSEPVLSLLACLMFGFSDAMVLTLSGRGYPVQILSMLPYVLALAVVIVPLILRSAVRKTRRRSAEKKLIVMDSGHSAGTHQ